MLNNLALRLCLLSCAAGIAVSACSTRPADTGKQKSTREPSEIDPENPPKVLVKNLKEGQVLSQANLDLELEVENYPLGDGWQEAWVVINDAPTLKVSRNTARLRLSEDQLRSGSNLLRVFLTRPSGKSLKNPEALVSLNFFVKEKKAEALRAGEAAILLNSPQGVYSVQEARKLLFDFVLNAGRGIDVSKLKIHYTLNGETRELVGQGPHYFQNLPRGNYHLSVQVLDQQSKVMDGEFSKSTTNFSVED